MSDETTELQAIMDEFEHECYMLRVEASETRARDDVVRASYKRIRDEFAGRIAATLGSETCSMEYGGDVTESTKRMLGVYFCSECGSPTYNDCMPYYCMYCGGKVVNA